MWIRAALVAILTPLGAAAQAPLSAIEWLSPAQTDPAALAQPGLTLDAPLLSLDEPPVAQSALTPDVTTSELGAGAVDSVGLLPARVTGFPPTLWRASDSRTVTRLMAGLDVSASPAMQALILPLLLAEAEPPAGAGGGSDFLLARIGRLRALGAMDQALALLERAGPDRSETFSAWMDIALLAGAEDRPCAALQAAPHLSADYAIRVFCLVRQGDWATAALALQGAATLGALDAQTTILLDLFLDPELAEDMAPPAPPRAPTALQARLYQALGQPIPTLDLPLAFAFEDLRGDVGWKPQILAAERLAAAGAITPRQWIGIYSDRRPAASGSPWDRVEGVQRFEVALRARDGVALGRALRRVWPQMQAVGLHVAFARQFARGMSDVPVLQADKPLVFQVALLSAEYELAARQMIPAEPSESLLQAVALGADETVPDPASLPPGQARSVAQAFAGGQIPDDLQNALDAGKLGEVILHAAQAYLDGQAGDLPRLQAALATFRAIGLEDIARRAALEALILSPGS